ncbi:MAG: hypothetical protein ABL889_12205 [Terricaulis sp.]
MNTAAAFRTYLNAAHAALNGGEAVDCERLAKAISLLIRAERDVAEYLSECRTASENDDEDAIRAELERRLAIFAAAVEAGHSDESLAQIAQTGVAP